MANSFKSRWIKSSCIGLLALLLITVISSFYVLVSGASAVQAASCGGVNTALLQCDSAGSEPINGVWAVVLVAINILAAGVGIAAVGGIVWGAIRYTTAGDGSESIAEAKKTIRNVVIGLILFVGLYSMLQYIIPGGVFGNSTDIPLAKGSSQSGKSSTTGGGSGGDASSDKDKDKDGPKPQQQTTDITVVEHNQTEGNMLPIYWTADVLLFSETDQSKIRAQSPSNFAWYFPSDAHQAIGWNTNTMRLDGSTSKRSYRFHQSGVAEGWENLSPPIRTPARFIHEVDLMSIKTATPITVAETWWLNSWRNEEPRRQIVERLTIPVVKQRFARVKERDRAGIAGGDINHITYNFSNTFPGWGTAPSGGLDRMFWTKDKRIAFKGVSKGPITGVGPQMKHESLISKFTLNAER